MADIGTQQIDQAGLQPSYSAASAGGDSAPNKTQDGIYIHVKSSASGQRTVVVNSKENCSFGFDHDVSVNIPAGEERKIGPLPRDRFGDPVEWDYDGDESSLTVGAFRLG